MKLIEARRNAPPLLSVRKAAEKADLSEGRWRQIAKGYQSVGGGVKAPVSAPPETIARMARAVGLTADELRAVGEGEIAELLSVPPQSVSLTVGSITLDGPEVGLMTASDEMLVEELARRLKAGAAAQRVLTGIQSETLDRPVVTHGPARSIPMPEEPARPTPPPDSAEG